MFGKFFRKVGEGLENMADAADRALTAHEMGRIAAVCAMMSYLPDGNADDDEISAGLTAIKHKFGDLYKTGNMVAEITSRVNRLKESKRFGKMALMEEIEAAKGTDEAAFLLNVAAAVGEAPDPSLGKGEDPFTSAERALAKEIAGVLGVSTKVAGF